MDSILQSFAQIFPDINTALNAGIPIFARVLGLMRFTPFLHRSEFPMLMKVGFALLFTVMLTMVLNPPAPPADKAPLIYAIAVNFAFGAALGFIVNCIISTIEAAGDIINMQMGVSSATVLDPSTNSQISVMGKFFSLLGILIFLQIGGAYWLFNAFVKSFTVFPLYSTTVPLDKILNMDYLVTLTSNVLYIGLQIASPVLLATLGQDIILGVISKTAPQINVFQLSFIFKPVFGAAILIWILPMIYDVIQQFYLSHANIF
ncbi:flagellar biosynthetic protein FliR [bacterium]|nr:flagellar biosynthetic protein FliR [bacterium]